MLKMIGRHVAVTSSRRDDSNEDGSLTREKERAAALPSFRAPDGEFDTFPALQERTRDRLRGNGIKSLFPIQ